MDPAMRNAADVCVIVATYNRPLALGLVLRALDQQRTRPAQIVIADDGSGEETRDVVEHFRDTSKIPVIHCWQDDQGFRKASALNRALASVTTKNVIFLDGDCIPLPHFIQDHLAFIQDHWVTAGPRILLNEPYSEAVERAGAAYPKNFLEALPLWTRGRLNRVAPLIRLPDGAWRRQQPLNWRMLRGCNFSARTADLMRVAGFDESFEGWGLEDSDLALRLINSNVSIKSGRFGCAVLHLWHKEEKRDQLRRNERTLQETQSSGRTVAVKSSLKKSSP